MLPELARSKTQNVFFGVRPDQAEKRRQAACLNWSAPQCPKRFIRNCQTFSLRPTSRHPSLIHHTGLPCSARPAQMKSAILSFPIASAPGPSGLCADHLRDCITAFWTQTVTRLLEELSTVCNKCLAGEIPYLFCRLAVFLSACCHFGRVIGRLFGNNSTACVTSPWAKLCKRIQFLLQNICQKMTMAVRKWLRICRFGLDSSCFVLLNKGQTRRFNPGTFAAIGHLWRYSE